MIDPREEEGAAQTPFRVSTPMEKCGDPGRRIGPPLI